MISLKSPEQIERMREAGKILYEVESQLRDMIKPGITTGDLDRRARTLIARYGAHPSSLHYEGYPCSICTSVNDEVVHGIPSMQRVLCEGDIVSVDCTVELNGWQADSAFTAGVGKISDRAAKLIKVTEDCFWTALKAMTVGNRIGDVGAAIEENAKKNGFSPIHDFTGHGIGRMMHEDPALDNYGFPGHGVRLRKGMTLAVEPMICEGDWHLSIDEDGWCARTLDHGWCAHYEHTVAVTEHGRPDILTLPGFRWEDRE